MPTEYGKGSMGEFEGVGSLGCIFEMEPIFLLPNQQLGERQPDQKEEAKKSR